MIITREARKITRHSNFAAALRRARFYFAKNLQIVQKTGTQFKETYLEVFSQDTDVTRLIFEIDS